MPRRMLMKRFLAGVTVVLIACGPTVIEDTVEYRDVAEITSFSVPDSASAVNIPVTIAAILGRTTASSFEAIVWERTDSLFQFVVYAKRIDKSGEQYEAKDITLDTTLVLTTNPQRVGMHYFSILSSTGGILVDSSLLY